MGVVIFAGFLLLLIVGDYRTAQRQLLLEAHKLYTSQAVVTHVQFDRIAENLPSLGPDARAFAAVDGEFVRLVVANDYEALPFPLHRGQPLSNNDVPQALVGANVPLERQGSRAYFELGGVRHEVVGYLGQEPGSVLGYSVVLKSPQLVPQIEPERVVADGRVAGERLRQAGIDTEDFDFGIERRANVDVISPVVFALGAVLSIFAFVSAGVVHGQDHLQYMKVRRLLGVAQWRGIAGMLLRIAAIGVLAVAAALLVAYVTPLEMPAVTAIAQAGAVALAIILASAAAALVRRQ